MIFAHLLRYLAADALRVGRWVAPGVVFLIVTASGTAVGGTAVGGFGLTATALFPISVWATVALLNSEDPTQAMITTAALGDPFTLRLAKLTLAYVAGQGLTALAIVWPLVTSHPATPGDVLGGIVAHLLTSLAGVTAGSFLSRPILRAPAWALMLGIALFLAEILIPGFPPVRPIAEAFSDSPAVTVPRASVLTVVALETLPATAVLVAFGYWLSRRRA